MLHEAMARIGHAVIKDKKVKEYSTVTIYVLLDPFTKEVRYVGATVDLKNRYGVHIFEKGRKNPKARWISSLLKLGTKPKLRVVESVPIADGKDAEGKWIAYFRNKGCKLLNQTTGGGFRGKIFSDSHRAKLRLASLGHTVSKAVRAKIAEANRRRPSPSKETRDKLSLAMKGRIISQSTRDKIRKALIGKKRPAAVGAKIKAVLAAKRAALK